MFVIYSANVKKETVLTDLMELNVPFKQFVPVKGAYKGTEEQAYVVYCNYDAIPAILDMVFNEYKQEAMLQVGYDLDCVMYTTGKGHVGTDVGKWKRVTQKKALEQDAYTRMAQEYFIVE